MTTLTTTYNITCQVCESIANAFKNTFKTIIKSRQMGLQMFKWQENFNNLVSMEETKI